MAGERETLYFSTKTELKINGIIYRPSICYRMPILAEKTLKKMAEDGTVTVYKYKVRFVNGVATRAE